jgi:hypothetical protein
MDAIVKSVVECFAETSVDDRGYELVYHLKESDAAEVTSVPVAPPAPKRKS